MDVEKIPDQYNFNITKGTGQLWRRKQYDSNPVYSLEHWILKHCLEIQKQESET